MNLSLEGRTALVCGSTQGIGKAAAVELASLGAKVVLLARNAITLEATTAELPIPAHQKHEWIVADFSIPHDLSKAVSDWILTGNPVDILINNTGGPPGGPIVKAVPDEFVSAFNNHLICNHLLAQAVLPGMMKLKYGRIINVISTSVKQPLRGLGVSNTIRAAVANWSKTLSMEVATYGITVNNVLPGATLTQRLEGIIQAKATATHLSIGDVETEMLKEIPANRFGKAEDIAAAIAFLATPAAGYINGINLPVDGGRTASL